MMQGFSSQLIPSEVGSDITSTNRPEIPELSLDQNFNNQSGINYVGLSVSSDLPLNRNIYSTVSLPQTIVSSIDQNQEALYVHSPDHLLEKNIPINQPYSSSVGGLLSLGPVVSHNTDSSLPLQDVSQISMDTMDKAHLLRNLKITFTNRSFESLSLSDIPIFLCEYVELRKAYSLVNKDESYLSLTAMEDPGNPPVSLLPQLLEEYKLMIQNLKRSFVCPTCHKSFTTRYSLNSHIAIHSETKPYECPHADCGKCFRTKSALNTHVSLAHSSVKDHICSICGKSYSKLWLLRQHELRHHVNHRYQCSKCEQSFAYPYLLKQHEISKHEGIKPYVCSFENCGRQFSSKSTLRLHELAHSRPFVCSVCYRQFGYACDLKRHLKKSHKGS